MSKLDNFKCARCMRRVGKYKRMLTLSTQEGPRGKAPFKPFGWIKICSTCRRGYTVYKGSIIMIDHDGVIEDTIMTVMGVTK